MFHGLFDYLSSIPDTIDSFDPFNIFEQIDYRLTPCFHITDVCHDVWHSFCHGEIAMFLINCEAIMWKITTRGFTLEEVLIMAAMNLLTSADTAAKRESRPSQKSKGERA
jgi:hypothetical protein